MKMVIITMVAKLLVAKHSNNNNNNIPVTLKYQVGIWQGIVMSHG